MKPNLLSKSQKPIPGHNKGVQSNNLCKNNQQSSKYALIKVIAKWNPKSRYLFIFFFFIYYYYLSFNLLTFLKKNKPFSTRRVRQAARLEDLQQQLIALLLLKKAKRVPGGGVPPVSAPGGGGGRVCGRRGQKKVFHVGITRKCTPLPICRAESRDKAFLKFLEECDSFFQVFIIILFVIILFVFFFSYLFFFLKQETEDTLARQFTPMLNFLDTAADSDKGERTRFARYPGLAFVEGTTDTPHVDQNDCPSAMCTIVVVGKFRGGRLFFPTLNLLFDMKAGDIITFKSNLLYHCTTPVYIGRRFAFVFFANHNLYNL